MIPYAPLPDLHYSPAAIPYWSGTLRDGRSYTLVGPAIERPWFEGIAEDPPKAARVPRGWVFAPARVGFSYGVVRGEARAWAFTTDGGRTRVLWAGRGDRARLNDLVSWTWTWHVRPACEARAPGPAAKLPKSWFR